MPNRSHSMEIANLVCRFGNEKVLLDMAEEIVLPSFFDPKLRRKSGESRYFFDKVSLVELDNEEGIVGIAGRLIKDTKLERQQIWKENKLEENQRKMQSSPSSVFLLILNNHRLIYIQETKDAPKKTAFRATLLNFLRRKHLQYIEQQLDEANADVKTLTKAKAFELTPKPTLTLIPLTSEASIEQFIKKYDVLKTLEISLSDRNDDNDNNALFDQLQQQKIDLDSKKSTVIHRNPKGLDKTQAVAQITEATKQGNQSVKLKGVDRGGDNLNGNNEAFQLKTKLENLSKNPKTIASTMYDKLNELVDEGLVKLPEKVQRIQQKVQDVAQRWRDES